MIYFCYIPLAIRNVPKLEQQRQKLKTKYDDLRKLDSDILGTLEAEDDILKEIEQTDLFNDEIELTILLLDEALSKEPDAQTHVTDNSSEEGSRAPHESNRIKF